LILEAGRIKFGFKNQKNSDNLEKKRKDRKIMVEISCTKKKRKWKYKTVALALTVGLLTTGTSVVYGAGEYDEVAVGEAAVRQAEGNANNTLIPIEEYLKKCWKEKQEKIDISAYKLTSDDLIATLTRIHYANPEYYWAFRKYNIEKDKENNSIVKYYYPLYLGSGDGPYDRSEELEREWEIVKEKTKDCETDLEKVIVVHEHLVDTISYSWNGFGGIGNSIEGAILEKQAVCEGYALAFKYYMNRLNIPCNAMGGSSKNQAHAWNQVQINGKWYLLDITWDDPAGKLPSDLHRVLHTYLLSSESKFNTDHFPNNTNGTVEPCTDTTYDNAKWKSCGRGMCAYKGGIYYPGWDMIDNKLECGIWRYDAKNPEKPVELVCKIDDQWNIKAGEKAPGAAEIAYYNGALYYNTPKAIWKWNFDPKAEPEKVLSLEENDTREIWDLDIANGKIYYETGVFMDGVRDQRKHVLDANYQKVKHPIAVADMEMTVEVGQKDVFVRAEAPGNITYTSKNPEICEVGEGYEDKSRVLHFKKPGETVVTVHADATDHYLEGSVDVKIIVKGESGTEEKIQLQYEAGANGSLKAVNAASDEALANGAQIAPNTEVEFTATPNKGYSVKNWIVNGVVYEENGQVYTGMTLKRAIRSDSDRVQVEFVKDEVEFVKGDVNLSGKVEIGDVREALRSICKKAELTEAQKQAADVNGNGTVDIEDLRKILRVVCGKIESL